MADDLVWEQPAPRGKYDWVGIAEALRKKPMEWAKVYEKDNVSFVVAIQQDSIAALRKDLGFETRTRNNRREEGSPRTCTLYLRYNPDKVKDPLAEAIARTRKGK